VTSVAARVVNLKTVNPAITHESLSDALISEFKKSYNSDCLVENLDTSQLEQIPSLKQNYETLSDWNWRYGQTPSFNHNLETRFDWGIMDVHINSDDGLINGVKIYSDSLFPNMIEEISAALQGLKYDGKDISSAMEKLALNKFKDTDCEKYIYQFNTWLIANI